MDKYKNGYIKITRKSIAEMFDICNASYFGNSLPRPKYFMTFTPKKQILGMIRPIPSKKGYETAIHISSAYNWTEENLRHVVVHEMIHYAIKDYLQPLTFWERWIPWLSPVSKHGPDFIEMMNDLNNRYGLRIAVRFPEMRPMLKK